MKCNNCQTEWNDNGNFSDLKNCPFCGKLLKSDKIVIDNNTSFGSVLKEIEKLGTTTEKRKKQKKHDK